MRAPVDVPTGATVVFIEARVSPGAAILEVGCGSGEVAGDLVARGYTVTGIEADAELAGHARRRGVPVIEASWPTFDGARVDAGSFVRARALRQVLRALASRNAHGSTSDDDPRIAFAALASEMPLRFALGERGDLRIAPADRGVNGALAEILSRVFEAQVSGEWRRLKSCPGPHCGWLFYDASRNASSRWCSMSICGNRTKTAAYRQRRRTET